MFAFERNDLSAQFDQRFLDRNVHRWVGFPQRPHLRLCNDQTTFEIGGICPQRSRKQQGLILKPSRLSDDHNIERRSGFRFSRHSCLRSFATTIGGSRDLRNPNTPKDARKSRCAVHRHVGEVVGDPGIEPGVGLPGGVTVRCRTLQPVART